MRAGINKKTASVIFRVFYCAAVFPISFASPRFVYDPIRN